MTRKEKAIGGLLATRSLAEEARVLAERFALERLRRYEAWLGLGPAATRSEEVRS